MAEQVSPKGPTAQNADALDSLDSTSFLRGSGTPTTSTTKTTATNYQPADTSRDTLLIISGRFSLTTAQSAVAEFCSDSNSTPTTIRGQATCDDAPATGSNNHPFSFVYIVKAGHYWRVNKTGSGTVALPYVVEIPL